MTSFEMLKKHSSAASPPAGGPPSSLKLRAGPLIGVLLMAAVLASIGSHLLVGWLKIETHTGQPWKVGPSNEMTMAFVAGSSIAGDGISWKRVATQLDRPIGGWGVAGASPYEMEVIQQRIPEATSTFVVISAYDMNEDSLSDFRADVVPVWHALRELVANRASWPYSKRVVSQYFVCWLRKLFPTIGRSRGVMGELRAKVAGLLGRGSNDEEQGPSLAFGEGVPEKSYKNARVTDWSESTILRKVEAMRTAFLGRQTFGGLKWQALKRMIQVAEQTGQLTVVVLPVSPTYKQNFLAEEAGSQFEESLSKLQREFSKARWVRIDQLDRLNSNLYFWDLVHMNADGQTIATGALLDALNDKKAP